MKLIFERLALVRLHSVFLEKPYKRAGENISIVTRNYDPRRTDISRELIEVVVQPRILITIKRASDVKMPIIGIGWNVRETANPITHAIPHY
jgi:hypothetical protein